MIHTASGSGLHRHSREGCADAIIHFESSQEPKVTSNVVPSTHVMVSNTHSCPGSLHAPLAARASCFVGQGHAPAVESNWHAASALQVLP